jgi:hypothetical protein
MLYPSSGSPFLKTFVLNWPEARKTCLFGLLVFPVAAKDKPNKKHYAKGDIQWQREIL